MHIQENNNNNNPAPKPNNRALTLEFYRILNTKNLLSKFILFDRIKYLHIERQPGKTRPTDKRGGFLHNNQITATAKELNISTNTLRQRLSDFKKLGWVTRTNTGYMLIGWKKLVQQYLPQLTKITYKAINKKTLIKIIAYENIKQNLNKQIYRENPHLSHNERKKISPALLRETRFSLSVRKVAQLLGYKSASTGSRVEKNLKKEKLLKIVKRNRRLCKIIDLPFIAKAFPELSGKCFIANGYVFERLCNNLIPLNDQAISRTNNFLKQMKQMKTLKTLKKMAA